MGITVTVHSFHLSGLEFSLCLALGADHQKLNYHRSPSILEIFIYEHLGELLGGKRYVVVASDH